jgi:hypothetical protein
MQKIVTRIRNHKIRFYYSNSEYRQHVSSCEIINATGEIILSIIILKSRQYLEKWFSIEIGLQINAFIRFNNSEYMNDELSIIYI